MDDKKKLSIIKLCNRVSKNRFPQFQCPNCENYSQMITNLNSSESIESQNELDHEAWDPMWIGGDFAAICACQSCGQKVYMVGTYIMDQYYEPDYTGDGRPELNYEEVYSVKYMSPAMILMALPAKCPKEVKEYIQSASEAMFTSPDLAASRIRTSIDELLTSQNVYKFKDKNGKQFRRTTHERIKLFEEKNKEVANLLEAVKWIGNEGTHDTTLTISDFLDGVEIYSLALDLLFDTKKDSIRKKAAEINKNKGTKKTTSSI
jgi:hypothetical protein